MFPSYHEVVEPETDRQFLAAEGLGEGKDQEEGVEG